MKYIIEYRHKCDNVGNEVENGLIMQPLQISWEYENSNYILESKLRFKTGKSDAGGTKQIVSNSIFDYY